MKKTLRPTAPLRKISSSRLLLGLVTTLVVFTIIASVPALAAPPLPGAIFTTDSTCTAVNLNIYSSKDAVYLNGGPQNQPGAAGLSNGNYYVQVTDPSGATVLGSSVGTPTPTPIQVTNGKFAQCYELSAIVYSASSSYAAVGYDDTPNTGGEYKVWVSKDSTFTNNSTKTDNFKVTSTPPPTYTISGKKFYDTALNGDPSQPGIQGWYVSIYSLDTPAPFGFTSYTTTTDASGNFTFPNLQAGSYAVCELLPSATPSWIPTYPVPLAAGTPVTYQNLNVGAPVSGDNFGNVCLGAGGGLTLGFWSNRNGQNLLGLGTPPYICALSSLNLVNAAGSPVASTFTTGCASPTTNQLTSDKTNLKNWLLSANATNMAYMLSAQLATMELNVASGGVIGGALVYAPGVPGASPAGLVSINTLMADANGSIGSNPNTVSSGAPRTSQEILKNALDSANNNLNFVQASACAVNYTAQDGSCAPVTVP